jgi:hypothetical protein
MSENFVRQLICICGTLVTLLAWIAGYFAGKHGWWWVAISVLLIYAALNKLIDA